MVPQSFPHYKSGNKNRDLQKNFFNMNEGRLLASGLLIGIIWLFELFILSFFNSALSLKLISMSATHIVSGRAGGISVGLELKIPHYLIVLNSMTIETIIVLVVFSIFLLSYKNYIRSKFLKNMIDTSIKAAKKNQKTVSKYGMLGLLLFVWFPLHMTGPLAGAIIGYFIGLRQKTNLIIVLSGTFLAILSWTLFFGKINNLTGQYSFFIPIFVVLLAGVTFLYFKFKKNHNNQPPH